MQASRKLQEDHSRYAIQNAESCAQTWGGNVFFPLRLVGSLFLIQVSGSSEREAGVRAAFLLKTEFALMSPCGKMTIEVRVTRPRK